jgi:hypothetical protein
VTGERGSEGIKDKTREPAAKCHVDDTKESLSSLGFGSISATRKHSKKRTLHVLRKATSGGAGTGSDSGSGCSD